MPVAQAVIKAIEMAVNTFRDHPHLESVREEGHFEKFCTVCRMLLASVDRDANGICDQLETGDPQLREIARKAIVAAIDADQEICFDLKSTRKDTCDVQVDGGHITIVTSIPALVESLRGYQSPVVA